LSASAHNIFNVVNLAPPKGPLAGRRTAPPTLPSSASPLSWRPDSSPMAPRCGTSTFRHCLIFGRELNPAGL